MDIDELLEGESYRDRVSTVAEDGSRNWVYAKKPNGKFYFYRKIIVALYWLFFLGIPFIKINGKPFMQINIPEGKFYLFSKIFWPQDFFIFAVAMIIFILFIALFTVVYGRIFCGWVCPQTVFLEFLYRPIEWLIEGTPAKQKRLNKSAWSANKTFKKVIKHIIYFVLAFIIINVFLSYFIGYEAVFKFLENPFKNVGLLIGVLAFSFLFYGVFAHVREIVCTTICPYGRLQGTLFDEDTMQIAYDYNRGEPRSKFKKNKERTEGDCIDCHQCVDVCPTGIDIRNGLQMECVGCTACIDACDFMMEHVNLPKGLIRYASEREIKTGNKIKFTTKAKAYTALLVILVAVLSVLILTRKDINVQIVRASGQSYTKLDNGQRYSNMYNLKAINKINKTVNIDVKLVGINGKIDIIGNEHIKLNPESMTNNPILITIDDEYIKSYKTKIELDIYTEGKLIQQINTNFIGPFK